MNLSVWPLGVLQSVLRPSQSCSVWLLHRSPLDIVQVEDTVQVEDGELSPLPVHAAIVSADDAASSA